MVQFVDAPEVEKLANDLIDKFHPDIREAIKDYGLNVKYQFRDKSAKKSGSIVLGQCRLCNEQEWSLHGYDFIITMSQEEWDKLKPEQKVALTDHEVSHMCIVRDRETESIKTDETTGKVSCRLYKHTIEEFLHIIERHGDYLPDVSAMFRAVDKFRVKIADGSKIGSHGGVGHNSNGADKGEVEND